MESVETSKLLLGIGNPVIDIIGETDRDTLKRYGLEFGKTAIISNQNYSFFEYLEKNSKTLTYFPGGSLTNSIKVAGWILKNNKNYSCSLIGSIGCDEYGTTIKDSLNNLNVKTDLMEIRRKEKTSRCAVGVCEKERCLLPQMRASAMISLSYIKFKLEEIKRCEIIFLEGYLIINKYEICEFLAETFTKMNKQIIFSLSAIFLIERFYEKMIYISNYANLIFGNYDEALAFSRLNPNQNYEIEDIAKQIHTKLTPKNRILVITRGKKPVFLSGFDYEQNELNKVLFHDVIEVPEDQIRDTNGCGDAFAGAYVAKYFLGESSLNCVKAGLWASSIVLRNIGCNFDFSLYY